MRLLSNYILFDNLQTEEYTVTSRHLVLLHPPLNAFKLEITTQIEPQNNTSLEV